MSFICYSILRRVRVGRARYFVSRAPSWLFWLTSSSSNWRGTSCWTAQHAHISFSFAASRVMCHFNWGEKSTSKFAKDRKWTMVAVRVAWNALEQCVWLWFSLRTAGFWSSFSKFKDVAQFVWQFSFLSQSWSMRLFVKSLSDLLFIWLMFRGQEVKKKNISRSHSLPHLCIQLHSPL